MGMMSLLLVMSNSDRSCPAVPGDPGWEMEDGQAKRRTEDNMLGMTQKVSQSITHNNKGEKQEVSPMVSERAWTLK